MCKNVSVCVPVHNCGEFLGEALDSILSQASKPLEVIVYDGGSTDNTPVLMEHYAQRWPQIRYHRSPSRGGIDADLETCISLAQGKYCWLFSGDDVMRRGAMDRAAQHIESGEDVYICQHSNCDKRMNVTSYYPVLNPDAAGTADLSDLDERLNWFRSARTTEAFFSFMSGLVIRKDTWSTGELPDDFNGSCWGHVARLFGLARTGLRVHYVAERWLDRRGENDSFADKGIVNRYRIAIEGYHRIGGVYFGHDSEEAFHIRRVLRNEFRLRMFLGAKYLCGKDPERENRALLDELVGKTYCDRSLENVMKHFIYRMAPEGVYPWARAIYHLPMRVKNRRLSSTASAACPSERDDGRR